jgi:hypothetical protein
MMTMRKRLTVSLYLEATGSANEAVLESIIQRMFEEDDMPKRMYLLGTLIESYGKETKRIQVTNPRD